MATKRYKVIQWATGQTGVLTLRGIIDHPELELVGVRVYSADKEGCDAGDVCGVGHTGVVATRDVEAILALDADCVCYMSTDLGRKLDEVIDDVTILLASGKNVVAAPVGLGFPAMLDEDLLGRLTEACRTGGSSFYSGGVNPDANMEIIAAAASMCQEVDSISLAEMYSLEGYAEPTLYMGFGIGLPPGNAPQEMWSYVWGPLMNLIAHGFRIEMNEFRHFHEVAVSPRTLVAAGGYRVEEGTVSAVHHSISGLADGECRVVAEGYYWVGDYPAEWLAPPDPSGYRIEIKGRPDLSLSYSITGQGLHEDTACLIATGMRLLNAIPAVCEAAPGIRTFFDLPPLNKRIPRVGSRTS